MSAPDPYAILRQQMVANQIETRGLKEPRLLAALRKVPRHRFVPAECVKNAYDDGPLPIGQGQTISQPYIVGLMTSLLALEGDETVLEVGTGSGYQAAVLAELARSVHTIERHAVLASQARATLSELSYANVFVHSGDGSLGWAEAAPYQGILVTAAAPAVPRPLFEQLAPGGRLVIPVGGPHGQDLQVWQRNADRFESEDVIPVLFVPLRGAHGWSPQDW